MTEFASLEDVLRALQRDRTLNRNALSGLAYEYLKLYSEKCQVQEGALKTIEEHRHTVGCACNKKLKEALSWTGR